MSARLPRLRQLVWACTDLEPAGRLRELFGLGEPFADPGVVEFGLENAVFALGDQFLEIVAPLPNRAERDTAAGRFLARGGAGGYMAIFEITDIAAHRAHLDEHGIRRVWNIDLEAIMASHLHPADVGGAIVSIDQPIPPGSWLWAGPDWEKRSTPGMLIGAELVSPDPAHIAARWGIALDTAPADDEIILHEGRLQFGAGEQDRLTAFHIAISDPDEVIARAKEMQLAVNDNCIRFEGLDIFLTKG